MGSNTAVGVLGTFRTIPRMTRSKMGVGRQLDRNGKRAFFGPYRNRNRSRNFHRVMRSARRSPQLFEDALEQLETRLGHLAVLTIFGEKNDPFGFEETWKGLFADARSWMVEGGNHFPMCDDPEGFAARLRRWHAVDVAAPVAPVL